MHSQFHQLEEIFNYVGTNLLYLQLKVHLKKNSFCFKLFMKGENWDQLDPGSRIRSLINPSRIQNPESDNFSGGLPSLIRIWID